MIHYSISLVSGWLTELGTICIPVSRVKVQQRCDVVQFVRIIMVYIRLSKVKLMATTMRIHVSRY
jgi:hypothetical protein